MATENKPVLGYFECGDCGGRGTVHAASGRRNQLYKRCGCGCDQRNGKAVQTRLWLETEWLAGLKPDSPPSVVDVDAGLAGQVDRAGQKTQGIEGDAIPGQQTEIEPESDPEKIDKTGLWWLAAGVAGLAALVGRV